MVNIKKVYAVNQGDDDRSSGSPCWFFEDYAAAKNTAFKRGWYGGDAPISEHNVLVVDGEAYLLARVEPVKLNESPDDILAKKQAVMAKLTDEELKLLGIR